MNIKSAKYTGDTRLKGDYRQIEVTSEIVTTSTEIVTVIELEQQIADLEVRIADLQAQKQIIDDKLKDIIKKL